MDEKNGLLYEQTHFDVYSLLVDHWWWKLSSVWHRTEPSLFKEWRNIILRFLPLKKSSLTPFVAASLSQKSNFWIWYFQTKIWYHHHTHHHHQELINIIIIILFPVTPTPLLSLESYAFACRHPVGLKLPPVSPGAGKTKMGQDLKEESGELSRPRHPPLPIVTSRTEPHCCRLTIDESDHLRPSSPSLMPSMTPLPATRRPSKMKERYLEPSPSSSTRSRAKPIIINGRWPWHSHPRHFELPTDDQRFRSLQNKKEIGATSTFPSG